MLTYQRQLNGYVAEVITKTSPEGRKWTFGYTAEGDIETVTDPLGNTTATAGDYTSTNTYDEWGQLLSAKDANGNTTAYGPFHASGYPTTITDAGTGKSYFTYDDRGNVTEVKNGKNAKVTQAYDTFGRRPPRWSRWTRPTTATSPPRPRCTTSTTTSPRRTRPTARCRPPSTTRRTRPSRPSRRRTRRRTRSGRPPRRTTRSATS
ncbi:hypothetical protein [Micromonospora sp. ATA51]|uniref:hypothetical protein n=1 Tax=Micromonospora sp. ATA51 TaxID=2806098 RepID=UPI001EE4AA90|nr:hypothetical protein [Micromonospora sp. ATA51]